MEEKKHTENKPFQGSHFTYHAGKCTPSSFTRLLDLFYLNLALWDPVSCVRFSPDGQLLAISSQSLDGMIHLFRTRDPLTNETSFERATLSPSVSSRRRRNCRLPRRLAGEGDQRFDDDAAQDGYVITQFDWSTDSRLLRSNGRDGQLRYWRLRRKGDNLGDVEDNDNDDDDDDNDDDATDDDLDASSKEFLRRSDSLSKL